ncbi:MAG: signal recognition particle protein [Deltaproteobacteria bacterium]|nr:signal recognition particle protein [Deltaproteobacteria bacterium]
MFDSLQQKLDGALRKIRGRSVLTQKDIEAAMREVRMALLEADVNFKVAKEFCDRVAAQASGEEILKSLTPDQQVIKLVHQELVNVMGEEAAPLNLAVAPPAVVMLVGLQGSGKTTTVGKLARFLRESERRKPLLVPADVYRPAAIDQLKTLGGQLKLEVFPSSSEQNPVNIAKESVTYASQRGFDVVIIDTAGRLQIDTELMQELREISDAVMPHEILLVVDAMTGQEAVNVAQGFDKALEIDGLILTKLDGDARGGAALSMRAVTGRPIKFIGIGEKLDALEVFHPERMASRILGMGDVLSLIEKATQQIDVEESLALQKKIRKNEFTFDDFLGQLAMVKKMGSITSLASMIPGMNKMVKDVDPEKAEKEMKHIEAIILSMTPGERRNSGIINGSRRRRIAKGSGTSVEEVNRLLKQFLEMKKMMHKMSKMGAGGLMKLMGGGMGGLGQMLKGGK